MKTLRLALAADPATGNAAGQPKLQAGLDYEFFGSPTLERLGDSGSALDVGPMDKGHNDWGLRFTGLLMPPADGEYAFRAEADTGLRLYLDGNPVIDGWAPDGARTGKVTLKKANPVAIMVMYFFDRGNGGKTAELRLFWTPPGGQEAPVPVTAYAKIVDVPKVSPWKRIAFDPSFGGAWVLAGDVDGDGEVEITGYGEPVADLVAEGADRFQMATVCDLTGDGYDDVLIGTFNGTAAYLYRNPRVVQPDRKMPLGSGVNVTLY